MSTSTNGVLHFTAAPPQWRARHTLAEDREPHADHPVWHPDAEALRRCAWAIGEKRPLECFNPNGAHVGVAAVTPTQGFAHWRIPHDWVEQTARARGGAWHHCRPVLRLYDVSYIVFNGFNAHRLQDHTLHSLCGQMLFGLPAGGTWQLAEVGFLLRSGEFIPAARSQAVPFAPATGSAHGGHAGLLVNGHGRPVEIGNVWEQERILRELRTPRLRKPLRLAAFAFTARAAGDDGPLARFVSELAAGQAAGGHEVHVFLPASDRLREVRQVDGAHYHPLPLGGNGTPLEAARAFGRAAAARLHDLPPFDLVHLHEWMTWLAPRAACPTVLSLGSVEATRRNGHEPSPLSREIERAERAAAQAADCILTPDWLRPKAAAVLGVEAERLRAFPMEGRAANEWECPLDFGRVKMDIGFGPLDRLLVFVGPLEHAAGPDILLEALPTLLRRTGNLRLAFVGGGHLYDQMQHRAHQLGVAGAVRLLGHVEGSQVTRLVRSAEALMLPSRWRVPFDDAVVDLARRAGRPVVTTNGGPTHLVRHEENGLITYDNPGSMVWAVDRIVSDPDHAERMGRSGRRAEGAAVVWSEVARHYLELCAAQFPELSETVM